MDVLTAPFLPKYSNKKDKSLPATSSSNDSSAHLSFSATGVSSHRKRGSASEMIKETGGVASTHDGLKQRFAASCNLGVRRGAERFQLLLFLKYGAHNCVDARALFWV